ncbi:MULTISPECIES: enoyl-CoA hydratase-related protein [unclassified Endozoicomonas]|uniref:enoyl-CoA hydratase-related protein n=1 Tax=unclassified Endozoicomonas TaxID=2644528 RepID=UPI0021478C92|nr:MULTISPECIES: enoyl-CoA hydratase-related protein [unclassified Endozoicomonas]
MSNSLIIETTSNGVASITMNRPEVGNAFNAELISELIAALKQLSGKETRLLQLRGSGKHFSAGGDLNWMKNAIHLSEQENYDDARTLSELLHTLNHFPAPTMAVVQGAAFGGAIGLICACDIALGAENTRFSLSEVKIGLIPAVISAYVVQAIGTRQARRYFLSAEVFSGEKALELGLLHERVPESELDTKAEELTQQLLGNAPEATRLAKNMLHKVHNKPINEEFVEMACQEIARIRVSPEGQEGLASFLEKRIPSWRQP